MSPPHSERAYVALGSNLGDRSAHLAFARAEIDRLPGTRVAAASPVEETAPFGGVPQGPFLNQMLAVETTLAPERLLDALAEVERRAGRARDAERRWGPRTLDCDIVLFGDRAIATARLTVPHPGLAERDWWQRELDALGAAWRDALARPPRALYLSERHSPQDDPAERDDLVTVTTTSLANADLALPSWAQVSEKRRAHIARVTALLQQWAPLLARDDGEAMALRDVGAWHDALRDAPEAFLREITRDDASPVELLHGPAAATLLERDGESRVEVLEAVRWHTIGSARWGRVGRALYVADFLEPGRKFAAADRAFLAALVPHDFDGVLRQVVRMRLEWSLREGLEIFPETASLWNAIR